MNKEFQHCPICSLETNDVVLNLASTTSVSSIGISRLEPLIVWFCSTCNHAFKSEINDTKQFYESEYEISVKSDEDDQIYEIAENGEITYRTQHQVNILLASGELNEKARVLDYGCAKGLSTQRLLKMRPDLQAYLFDVTSQHHKRWKGLVPEKRTATYVVPMEWSGIFDLVFTLFTLEHIPNPTATLLEIHKLLRDGGRIHGVVPDPLSNIADVVVVDHVNHFSNDSLRILLERCGFSLINIDGDSHTGAFTFDAIKKAPSIYHLPTKRARDALTVVSNHWIIKLAQILTFEESVKGLDSAIFGCGVNGSFIFHSLRNPSSVKYFIDNSPHLQGSSKYDRPVVGVAQLPRNIRVIYSGLNPNISMQAFNRAFTTQNNLRILL